MAICNLDLATHYFQSALSPEAGLPEDERVPVINLCTTLVAATAKCVYHKPDNGSVLCTASTNIDVCKGCKSAIENSNHPEHLAEILDETINNGGGSMTPLQTDTLLLIGLNQAIICTKLEYTS